MPRWPNRQGKERTRQEVRQLRELARENTPTRITALKMGRTGSAVRSTAAAEGISLKPTNQSPYSRRRQWLVLDAGAAAAFEGMSPDLMNVHS